METEKNIFKTTEAVKEAGLPPHDGLLGLEAQPQGGCGYDRGRLQSHRPFS